MDAGAIGNILSELRKKNGWTQGELAEKLNVSTKTVSKWERGHGYPEITQFPVLAELYGVTIDYIMMGRQRGIGLAGNILVDLVKTVDKYPNQGMLTKIRSVSRAVGGAVPNVGIDLAKIDRLLPVTVYGKIGDDDYGRFVKGKLTDYGINTDFLITSSETPTGFTDVISQPAGERTFFNLAGTNDEFSPDDIDISKLSCRILHIGYIMLLAEFDRADSEYGTVMARFLHDVREHGIKTSIDVVSSNTANYRNMIIPALKYSDYAIINEVECCGIWDVDPYDGDGTISTERMYDVMRKTVDCGIAEKLIVHAKSAAFCLDVKSGEFTVIPSLDIPSDEIKGSTGAGDAFCAGCLYGLYNGMSDREILEFASAAAACNLFEANSVDGMRNREEIYEIMKKYGRKRI